MKIEPHNLINSISDQTRLRILFLLNHYAELCVCDLVTAIDTNQPKISRHLKVLRDAGLINTRRDGTWIHYRMNPELPTWGSSALKHLFDGCSLSTPYPADLKRLDITMDSARCK